MTNMFSAALVVILLSIEANAFSPVPQIGIFDHVSHASTGNNGHRSPQWKGIEHPLSILSMSSGEQSLSNDEEEDVMRQWDLFKKYHAKGQWRGTWTSYDYIGDEIDSTLASVILQPASDSEAVKHEHEIITGSVKADCDTCFDSTQARTIPVATYTPTNLGVKQRLASVGMVTGPSLLRSGAMSTEVVLSHGESRLRVVFMHGPCWPKDVEPNSCPPMGLKLFRTMVSREALGPFPGPTREGEQKSPPAAGNASFFRPVPPFQWHAKWAGSSWTYGPQNGDKGWSILDMDEVDSWHGRPTGDNENVWAMRLGGGVLVQCPRVVYGGEVGLCRVAWMPEAANKDTGELGTLLRLEAGVSALDPILNDDESDMVGFKLPTLSSLRCDTLKKTGELEGTSMLNRDDDYNESVRPGEENQYGSTENTDDTGLDAVRKSLEKLLP